jgi:hypothetical protein
MMAAMVTIKITKAEAKDKWRAIAVGIIAIIITSAPVAVPPLVTMVPAISLAAVPTMNFLDKTVTQFWKGGVATC